MPNDASPVGKRERRSAKSQSEDWPLQNPGATRSLVRPREDGRLQKAGPTLQDIYGFFAREGFATSAGCEHLLQERNEGLLGRGRPICPRTKRRQSQIQVFLIDCNRDRSSHDPSTTQPGAQQPHARKCRAAPVGMTGFCVAEAVRRLIRSRSTALRQLG